MSTFKKGDLVKLIHLDGTLSEAVTVHDLWGDDSHARNASIWSGNQEQFTHTDLMRHADDTSPVVVPDFGTWFIARGDNMGWGRATTADNAARNMRRQGGAIKSYVVHRVTKWTTVNDMGDLSFPGGIESAYPVLVKEVRRKPAKATA
jgi:hypothetical protein